MQYITIVEIDQFKFEENVNKLLSLGYKVSITSSSSPVENTEICLIAILIKE